MLTDISRAKATGRFGSKATNLGRLLRLGMPTPGGVVIDDSAHQSHLRRAGVLGEVRRLHARLDRITPQEAAEESLKLRDRIAATPLHPALQRELDNYCEQQLRESMVVRSSAVGEDGDQLSFAGQLESILNISSGAALTEAIKRTWASLWSQRALLYAQHFGVRPQHMGVIIQGQVNARLSGVLFTRDPQGRHPDSMLIEYCEGLGDRLVDGAVDPIRLRIDRSDLSVIADSTGTPAVDLDPGDEAALVTLARMALEVEAQFGGAQDIEWCVDQARRPILLQSRPITGPRIVHWSNANIAENYPDPVTPFLFSIVKPAYTAYFRGIGRGLGVPSSVFERNAWAVGNIVGLHGGRLYYNVTAIHELQQLVPGGGHLNRFFNHFVGTNSAPAQRPGKQANAGRLWPLLRVACIAGWRHLRLGQGIRQFERRIDRFARDTHPASLGSKSAAVLADDLREFLDIRMNRWRDPGLADNAAMVCYGMLKEKAPTLHNGLLKGLPGLASIEPVRELWKLSRRIRADAPLAALFATATYEGVAQALATSEHRAFREEFDRYLDQWGFRFSGELMLTTPTPRENPLPVLRLLQTYVNEPALDPDAQIAAQAASREAMTASMARELTPVAAWRAMPLLSRANRFRLLLRATHATIRFRERARMKQALLYTRLRHIALAAGERLVQCGAIAGRDDVFMLTIDEVLCALGGGNGRQPELASRVAMRRRQLEDDVRLRPPDHLSLPEGEHWLPSAQPENPVTAAGQSSLLRGLGASAGLATGEAAVLLDVARAEELRPGQILVTRQTDPGWATVFFLARGLVVERGGMLSHGAIIAREYGIPAVIGVADATRLIRNGNTVSVDGNSGQVHIGDD